MSKKNKKTEQVAVIKRLKPCRMFLDEAPVHLELETLLAEVREKDHVLAEANVDEAMLPLSRYSREDVSVVEKTKKVETGPKIEVYLDDGRVFVYHVIDGEKAREHSHAIVMTGYRHVSQDDPEVLTHYPPHRILKVKVSNSELTTNYKDYLRGT